MDLKQGDKYSLSNDKNEVRLINSIKANVNYFRYQAIQVLIA